MSEEIVKRRGRPKGSLNKNGAVKVRMFKPPKRDMIRGRQKSLIYNANNYPDKEQWEEYAEILSRRLCMPITAGYSKPLGRWLELELVKGIVNRVYCDHMTEDNVFPIRHMVERFRHNYLTYLYDLARERFFGMLWKNGLVIRELVDDEVMKKFRESRKKAARTRKNEHTPEDGMNDQREYEIAKNRRNHESMKRRSANLRKKMEELGIDNPWED